MLNKRLLIKFFYPIFTRTVETVEIEMSVKSFKVIAELAKKVEKGDTLEIKDTNDQTIRFIMKGGEKINGRFGR